MDEKELAKLSKDQDIIIVFAFGNKYARQLHNTSEKVVTGTLDRLSKKIIKDYKNNLESPESRTFILHVIQGPDGTPCPEKTCVHTFHSDAVMTDHVKANHPMVFAALVAKKKITEPKEEPKTVTYL